MIYFVGTTTFEDEETNDLAMLRVVFEFAEPHS